MHASFINIYSYFIDILFEYCDLGMGPVFSGLPSLNDRFHVEIILISFFIIYLRGIGQGLSDAIISSFKIFVCVH